MKWSKRMWLSIIRRPVKSLLIFLVVFIMSSLLAGALSIVQTSDQIKKNLKASISPQISVGYEKEYKENKKKYIRETNVEEMKEYISILDNMKKDENILIEFYRPKLTEEKFGMIFPGTVTIRFRNSGSYYHPFNFVFMRHFNKLQEFDPVLDNEFHQLHIEELTYQLKK